METKVCSKCDEEKLTSEFRASKRQCKACTAVYGRSWRGDNKDRIRARNAAYRKANKEKIDAYREATREKAAAYRKNNPDMKRRSQAKRKAMKLNAFIEDVTGEGLIERHGDKCIYCADGAFEHIEHVMPLSLGGKHGYANCVPSCASCNLSKHNKHPSELGLDWLVKHLDECYTPEPDKKDPNDPT